jgi:hypothetical protein
MEKELNVPSPIEEAEDEGNGAAAERGLEQEQSYGGANQQGGI